MIDHVAARRLAATAIDLPLETDEATELERHLATCPACRTVSSALARDAAALRHLDLGPVPVAVRADLAIAADRGRSGPVGRWGALVALAALLVVALGSGMLGGIGAGRPADDPGGVVVAGPVDWRTGLIDLHASDLWIRIGDRRLGGASDAAVKAALGQDSRTLEAVWKPPSGAVSLRLLIVSVEGRWLVKGVQAWIQGSFDQWLDGHGPLIGSEVGAGPVGDVDLDLVDTSTLSLSVRATLHVRDLSIVLGPVPVPPDQPVPAAPGQAVPLPVTPAP